MTPQVLDWLASGEGQRCLCENATQDPQRLALNAHRQPDKPLAEIAEQLHLRRNYAQKFGPWIDHILLTRVAAEQAASYATARWKAQHLEIKRSHAFDLCAGLGIDALARAAHGQAVVAVEQDPLRAQLLQRNAELLQLELEVINGDGLQAMTQAADSALLLCDPDRRASGQRSLDPQSWLPDPLAVVQSVGDQQGCLLKLPPGSRWQELCQQLPGDWRGVVLSARHECKEVLLQRQQGPTLAVGLNGDGSERFRWQSGSNSCHPPCRERIGNIFVDPDPAIIRSGLVAELLVHFDLAQVHPLVAFGHGDDPGPQFPGHRYQVIEAGEWDAKIIKACCKRHGIKALRVSRRHFPWDPPTTLKRLKLREGGNWRLCCYRDAEEHLCWVLGRHLND